MKARILTICLASLTAFSACNRHAEEAKVKMHLARSLVTQENYAEAVPILSEVIDSNDSLPAALNLRGTCYTFMDQNDLAIHDFRRILSAEDATCAQKINALNDLSNIYTFMEVLDSTARLVREMIDQHRTCPSSIFSLPHLYIQLATIKINSKQFDLARSLIDTALTSGIDTFEYASTLAYLSSSKNEIDSAVYWLSVSVETKDTVKNSYINWGYRYFTRGEYWHRLGKTELACADWDQAVSWGLSDAQAKLDSFCRKEK